MTTAPAVSVVIPTYNQSRLLIKTLESVFAQTFTDYEVIVVNDGCTDDTLEQLRPYTNRVRIITQPNGGIGVARNSGIAAARGKYVALLDHDDLWMPDKLDAQVKFLEQHPECCAVSVPYAESSSPDTCVFDLQAARNSSGIVERPLQKLVQGHMFIMTSSVLMFVRDKAKGLWYGTQRGCIEDMQFNLGLFSRGLFGIAGDSVLAIYRIHEANFSAQASYYYNGLKHLRKMERAGELVDATAVPQKDLLEFLADLGRVTAVRQLNEGLRWRGFSTYLQEFLPQLQQGRAKFLLVYPALLLMPHAILQRRWPQRAAHHDFEVGRLPSQRSSA